MSRNGGEGILLEGGEGFRVRHNRLVRNGGGITLGPGSGNVITRNRVFGGGEGIRIEKGHGNLVAPQRRRSARGAGIRLGIRHPFSAAPTTSSAETGCRDSRGDGFLVGRKERHSLLKRQRRHGGEGRRLRHREPLDDADPEPGGKKRRLGIDAVLSVIDGGGNRAHGNGDPRQCVNIVCN